MSPERYNLGNCLAFYTTSMGRRRISHYDVDANGEASVRCLSLAAIVASTIAFTQGAVGADMPAKAPVRAVPAVYSWAGWYVGLNAGGAWGHSDDPTSTVFSPLGYFAATSIPAVNAVGLQSTSVSGFTGGIQGGYNWQLNNFVAGVEADFGYFGLRG